MGWIKRKRNKMRRAQFRQRVSNPKIGVITESATIRRKSTSKRLKRGLTQMMAGDQ